MSVCWKLKYARTMCNINTRCLHDTVDICISFIQGFLLNLIVSFSTNSSLVGPCSLASLFHALPPCWSSYRSSFNRSSIFSGLRRRSYAKQAKLRHYPLANQRFLRSVRCDVSCTLCECYKHTLLRYFRSSYSFWFFFFYRFRPSEIIRYVHTNKMHFCFDPLARAFSNRCDSDENSQRISVDRRPKHIEMYAFSNEDAEYSFHWHCLTFSWSFLFKFPNSFSY